MLVKSANQSLHDQLAGRFAERIRNRLIAPGARLPSVRQCAHQQEVSPSTVVAAYDRLLALGLVEARRNRGFFVREPGGPGGSGAADAGAPLSSAATVPATRPALNASTLIRGMLQPVGDRPQPGAGIFPPGWLESSFIATAVRKVTHGSALAELSLQYGEPFGDAGLRRSLSQRLTGLAIQAPPEQILTTVGATHALDIVSRTLLRPGDHVMVEEPGWAVEFARLRSLGMHLLPVPRREGGPDLDVMARYCAEHAPKLFISVSVLHNPTGYCLTPGSAHRLLQLAEQRGFHVMEDDTYAHLAPESATRLCALPGVRQ